MSKKIFIDGQAGTTGLQIQKRLESRSDLELLSIAHEDRKNQELKKQIFAQADLVILCLPDDAAKEAVALAQGLNTRILDASTAFRVDPNWVYGLAELCPDQRQKIQTASRVSNPGCYPTGFLLAVRPLVEAGILPTSALLCVNAVSGYSGGGHKLMDQYQAHQGPAHDDPWAFRPYALHLAHKHLPEMKAYAKLETTPLFQPAVGDFAQGMLVQVPLHRAQLQVQGDALQRIEQIWQAAYGQEEFVQVMGINPQGVLEGGYLDAMACNGSNRVELFVYGHQDQILLTARLDNLGKGASGAAVQNLNLMLGLPEGAGL